MESHAAADTDKSLTNSGAAESEQRTEEATFNNHEDEKLTFNEEQEASQPAIESIRRNGRGFELGLLLIAPSGGGGEWRNRFH